MQTSTLSTTETITETTVPDMNTGTGFPDIPEDYRYERHSCRWDESICDNAATHFITEFCQDPNCTASHQSYYCAQHYAIMLSRIIAHLKECPGYKHPEPCDENRNVTLAHIAAFGKIEDDDIDVSDPWVSLSDSADEPEDEDAEPLWATDDTVIISPRMSLDEIRSAIAEATDIDYFHTPLHVVRFKPLPADLPEDERVTEVLQFNDLHLSPVTHWSPELARDFERGADTSLASSLHMVYESVTGSAPDAPLNASETYGRFIMHAQIPPTPQMIAEDDDPDAIPGVYGIVTDRLNLVRFRSPMMQSFRSIRSPTTARTLSRYAPVSTCARTARPTKISTTRRHRIAPRSASRSMAPRISCMSSSPPERIRTWLTE